VTDLTLSQPPARRQEPRMSHRWPIASVDNHAPGHLDCRVLADGVKSSPPSDTGESQQDEENFSTQQPEAKEDPWVPGAVSDQGGSARSEAASPEGAPSDRSLTRSWASLARSAFERDPISGGSCGKDRDSRGDSSSWPCDGTRTRSPGSASPWGGESEARSRGTASSASSGRPFARA
jgi:hypothetical protein